MNNFKSIIFDLDETLINRHETMRQFLKNQHKRFDALKNCDANTFSASCLEFQENGYADKLEAYTKACTSLGITNPQLPTDLFTDFKARYGTEAVAFKGSLAVIEVLHEDFTLGLVTNGRTIGQTAKLESAGLASFFSAIVISESHGVKKPDHSIFTACLDQLGVSAKDAIFIGDNPAADITPAKDLGMSTIWMRNDYFKMPDKCDEVASDVRELPMLIAKLCEAQSSKAY